MRKPILSQFLNRPVDSIFEWPNDGPFHYNDLTTDYVVLTEQEANHEARQQVWSLIFSFELDFLNQYLPVKLTQQDYDELISSSCECCQRMMLRLMPDAERFLDEAVQRYGRAPFICYSDIREHRVEYGGQLYYIYSLA